MLFVENKFKSWLICLFVLSFVIIPAGAVFSQTQIEDQDLVIAQDVLATDEKEGLLYTIDASGDLITIDLQTQKINRIKLGLSGFVQRIITHFSPKLLFITEVFPDKTGRLYILDKSAVKQGLIRGPDVVTAGRGRLLPAFNSKTNKIYLTSSLDRKVLVIDVNTGTGFSEQQISFLKPSTEIPLGTYPEGIIIDEELNRIYVLSEVPGILNIIDGSTDKLIKTIPLPGQPRTLAVDEKAGHLFISGRVTDKLLVFDTKKDELIASMAVAAGPNIAFFDNVKEMLYLLSDEAGVLTTFDSNLTPRITNLGEFANYSSGPLYVYPDNVSNRLYILNAFTSSLFVVDNKDGRIIKKITVDGYPLRIAGWSEGKKIFLLRRNSPRLLVFDEADLSLQPFLKEEAKKESVFFSSCQGIIADPAFNLLYVTNLGNNTVTVIDAKTKKPFKVIPVGEGPLGIALNPKSGKLYTTNRAGNSVTVINTADYSTKTIPVGITPNNIRINSETNKIYITQSGDNKIAVIDGDKDEVLKYIPVGIAPQGLNLDTIKNKIYVANFGEDTVSVIDGKTDEVTNVIKVEKTPRRLLLLDNKIFVLAEGNNSMLVIDQTTEKIIARKNLKAIPYHIVWDEGQRKIFVLHKHKPLVTIIDPDNYEILAEKEFPFFSLTDYYYNKFVIDWNSRFIYFTQSSGDAVHLVKIEGNLSDGSLKLAAIIKSNGEVVWQPGFEPSPREVILFIQAAKKWIKENAFLAGGATIIFIILLIGFLVYRKKYENKLPE